MSACPHELNLRLLGTESHGDATFSRIEEHVEACISCQQRLQRMVRGDLDEPLSVPRPARSALPDVPGFVLERELGRGHNGVVYLARETAPDRQVALKFLKVGDRNGPATPERRFAEARAVAQLRHPNIVQLYQVVELQASTVLVLEYVPGGTLKDRLSAPLAPQAAARILERIADTIGDIHQAGRLHLDVKPSNILVDGAPGCVPDASTIKVSDFGISLPIESRDGWASPRGTPSYMAPEQTGTSTAPIDPAADVYALGALLYHLLTGRPPFQAPTPQETLELVRTVEPVSPRQLDPRIPRDLELICLHCLRKQADKRYPSAGAVADDLRRFLDGRGISVRRVSAIEQAARWCRRRPAIAALSVMLLITVIASLCGLIVLLDRSESDRDAAITARQQAEEKERIASSSLKELEVWIQAVTKDPRLLERRQTASFLADPRKLTMHLHGEGDSTLRMIATVSMLYRDLARKLSERPDRVPEARALLETARRHLRFCLRFKPDADVLQTELVLNLLESAIVAENRRDWQPDEAAELFAEAARYSHLVQRTQLRFGILLTISLQRRHMAYGQWYSGNLKVMNRILAADLESLNAVSPADAKRPDIQLAKALTLSASGRTQQALPALQAIMQMKMTGVRHATKWSMLMEWVAVQVIPSLLRPASTTIAEDQAELQQHGKLLVQTIRETAQRIGIARPDVPRFALAMTKQASRALAVRRRDRRLDELRCIEQRYMAFARQLISEYPNHADACCVLSEAYMQIAKNAWCRDANDTVVIVPEAVAALRHALSAAERALKLAPTNNDARRLVDDRKRRLLKALTERASH